MALGMKWIVIMVATRLFAFPPPPADCSELPWRKQRTPVLSHGKLWWKSSSCPLEHGMHFITGWGNSWYILTARLTRIDTCKKTEVELSKQGIPPVCYTINIWQKSGEQMQIDQVKVMITTTQSFPHSLKPIICVQLPYHIRFLMNLHSGKRT